MNVVVSHTGAEAEKVRLALFPGLPTAQFIACSMQEQRGNPIVHFWLHHTAHYAEKIVSAHLWASGSEERVGQEEVGGVTGRVLCTWWLLDLAFKRPWLAPGGPPPTLTAWTGLENTTLTLQRAGFWQERLLGL